MRAVVITHDVADFDAIASAVAVRKLYPHAQLVRRKVEAPSVRRFLALHRNRFDFVAADTIAWDEVTTCICVDVRDRRRLLPEFERLLARIDAGDVELVLYDHHPSSPHDVAYSQGVVRPAGAAVTLVLEALQAQGLTLSPEEATLCALGIHADTGSLLFPQTTLADVDALRLTLAQDAHLDVVRSYLAPSLTDDQRQLLIEVLSGAQERHVGGQAMQWVQLVRKRAVSGLSAVVAEALEVLGASSLFVAVEVAGQKTQIAARSREGGVDVGRALRPLGGGGHACAAAATVASSGARAEEALFFVLSGLEGAVPRVRDIMSHAVFVLDAHASLREAHRLLEQWGCIGAPVVRAGAVVGVLSVRDIDRARHRGDSLDVPVAGRMSAPAIVADPQTPLADALELIGTKGIGRVPVVDQGKLVGIVSRGDILGALYHRDVQPA